MGVLTRESVWRLTVLQKNGCHAACTPTRHL